MGNKFNSPRNKTRLQSSMVPFTCSLAKCSVYSLVSSNAIAGLLLSNPAILSIFLTVRTETVFDLLVRLLSCKLSTYIYYRNLQKISKCNLLTTLC